MDKGLNHIKDIVFDVLKINNINEQRVRTLERIDNILKRFSKDISIMSFKNNILKIEVPSSVVMQEMMMKKHEILAIIEEDINYVIENIKFIMTKKQQRS